MTMSITIKQVRDRAWHSIVSPKRGSGRHVGRTDAAVCRRQLPTNLRATRTLGPPHGSQA